ncbi:gastrin-releasing peptide [Electrophorus electricus]|uniref:gastrin-releasing peptide n=1 Tax=Electrophorus electricus TaxID=8005 RepID=UPI0015D03FDF|nr:gastrin-releasing peptide [Electrophorus electricus]
MSTSHATDEWKRVFCFGHLHAMRVPWRCRLAITACALLVFTAGDAQPRNEARVTQSVHPRGNHWAVGHLMGKKSIHHHRDGGSERDSPVAWADQKPDGDRKSAGLPRALGTVLAGPERETKNERESVSASEPNQGTPAWSRLWEKQLTRTRDLRQVVKLLFLASPSEAHAS